jgi:hypothetical protein
MHGTDGDGHLGPIARLDRDFLLNRWALAEVSTPSQSPFPAESPCASPPNSDTTSRQASCTKSSASTAALRSRTPRAAPRPQPAQQHPREADTCKHHGDAVNCGEFPVAEPPVTDRRDAEDHLPEPRVAAHGATVEQVNNRGDTPISSLGSLPCAKVTTRMAAHMLAKWM